MAVDERSALLARVRERLVETRVRPTPTSVAAAVRSEGRLLGESEIVGLSIALEAEIHGLGPLDPLVRDPRVTDVLVNAPDEVWVDRGEGLVAAEWLRAIVGARLALVLTGGTGTGKTTVLSTLLGAVDPAARLVLVEDSAELRPDHPHVVRLESRPVNVEGAGEVTMRDLVRQALRMRPDRLVVGEARGAEVADLLAALNTGHEGGCATLHANTAAAVPARLEALGAVAGLGRDALHAQVAAALDVVVHLVRDRDGRRRLAELAVLDRGDDGLVVTTTALAFARDGTVRTGPGEAALRT